MGWGRNSRVKHAHAWAMQGWVALREERYQGEKSSRVKGSQAWAVQRWMTSWWLEVLVPGDHQFQVINL